MSAQSPDATTGTGTGTAPPTPPVSGRLGIVAFILAVFFAALPWLLTLAFALTSTGGSDSIGVAVLGYLAHILGLLAALTLGILAIVQRRGRRWGIAAVVVCVLFSQTVLTVLLALFGGLTPQV